MTKTRTIAQANRAIAKAGLPLELVRGDGYHYFVYDDRGPNYTTVSVYTCYTSDLSVEQWVEEARTAMETVNKELV